MKKLTQNLKKIVAVLLIALVLTVHSVPASFAQEAPTAPAAPSAPVAPSGPTAPSGPVAPNAPVAPSGPVAPTPEPTTVQTTPTPTPTPKPPKEQQNVPSVTPTPTPAGDISPNAAAVNTSTVTPTPTPTGEHQNATSGDVFINTGNATETGLINTLANTNTGVSPTGNEGATVVNSGNGAGSTNDSSVGVINNNTTTQVNTANVGSSMDLASNSGHNTANDNMGDSVIKTGDANTTGTVITGVNTNVDGVAVSEFNIADDHTGDIVLDFGSSCISGCGNFGITAGNTNNGANSTNNSTVDQLSNNTTFQTNTADVGSEMTLSANSGYNETNRNGGGTSFIETGDANVAANALTFVNNNIAGNVVLGVVNIFGNLIGDIIIPDQLAMCSSCAGGTTASNTGNLAGSTNNTTVNNTQNDATFQTNNAVIDNQIVLDGNTGGNEVNRNGQGDSYIKTGDTNVSANTLNIANSNIASDGVWWLAIVNQAGQWVGKIIGSPDGATMAGSTGTEFVMNADGTITALNSGNGANSTNNTTINNTENNTTTQTNNATITNTLNLSANTGNNEANDNIGGDNVIKTGDAQVIANLVNFVNNNVTGGGKLMVTVVNVFGTWVGDLVTPGQKKQEKATELATVTSDNQQNQNNGSNPTPTPTATAANNSVATPTPTKTPTATGSTHGNSQNNGFSYAGGTGTVLGAHASKISSIIQGVSSKDNVGKSITLNIAWLLLTLPLLGVLLLKKRLIAALKR